MFIAGAYQPAKLRSPCARQSSPIISPMSWAISTFQVEAITTSEHQAYVFSGRLTPVVPASPTKAGPSTHTVAGAPTELTV